MGLNYNYQVAVDSENGMVVEQYLTQNATDAYELFEMLHEIKIEMGINPQVVVAYNEYMNDNVIKYAYENNIRSLIPDRSESSKSKSKKDENPYGKPILSMIGKQTHSSALKVNNCTTETIEN